MTQKAAALYDSGDDMGAGEAANMAKYAAAEASIKAVDRRSRCTAATGMTAEYGLGALVAAARVNRIAPVSREMILNFVAQNTLGLPEVLLRMTDVLREPQQDRSRATRQRLLEAAIECLAEVGWSGSTVAVVAERAGVSRGAAQHHFPTREDLVTSAVEYVLAGAARAAARARRRPAAGPGPDPGRGRHGRAVLHRPGVPRGASTCGWRRRPTSGCASGCCGWRPQVGRETHRLALDLLGVDESVPGVREAVQATLDMARGLGLANLLSDDGRRRARVLRPVGGHAGHGAGGARLA